MNRHVIRIESINDDRVALYTEYNEPQLVHYNEPDGGVFIAETPAVIERALSFGTKPLSFFVESGALLKDEVQAFLGRAQGVPVYEAELSVINKITGFNLTRGMLAAFERPELPDPVKIIRSASLVAVLEDIVNPTNVGAIFRSAAALGIDAILLTSASSDPFYRRAARVSMGTVFMVPWTYIPKDTHLADILHDNGYAVISMEITKDAVPLTDPVLKQGPKRAVIFGAEGSGVAAETLQKSDHIAYIPMYHDVDSLNVAAASAVTFWELGR